MENATRQIVSILVNNQPGVLSRIAGLFSRRGYNIDGLTVCATEDERWSRMTITVNASPATVKQIVAQLEKQEDVVKVMDFDVRKVVTRELLLIKVAVGGAKRSEIVDLCTLFGAKAIDVTAESNEVRLLVIGSRSYTVTQSAYDDQTKTYTATTASGTVYTITVTDGVAVVTEVPAAEDEAQA